MGKIDYIISWTWRVLTGLALVSALSGCGAGPSTSANPLRKAEPSARPPQPSQTPLPSPTYGVPQTVTPGADTAQPGRDEMITITVIFDNYPHRPGLQTSWGFAALVEFQGRRLLFDTGGSGSLLLSNMAALGIEPEGIDTVVLSHEHADHIGGLQALLYAGAHPVIYIPPSFSKAFKDRYQGQAQLVESRPGLRIAERIYTTGEISGPPPEQALVIDTTQGLVVITGCAHPGVDKMLLEAKRQYKEDIYLVLGGFHLGGASDARVNAIIKEFRRLGVQYAAPCHCTGDQAIALIRTAYGEDFLPVGVGAVIEIPGQ